MREIISCLQSEDEKIYYSISIKTASKSFNETARAAENYTR
jgi:hypothetical protein